MWGGFFKYKISLFIGSLIIFVVVLTAQVSASPMQWTGNNHYYDVIKVAEWIDWSGARDAAQARYFLDAQGYLATITSAEEQAFIMDTFGNLTCSTWLGGFQPKNSPEPAGGWQWVTNERFTYTNWATGEPNNASGHENVLMMSGSSNPGKWNDYNDSPVSYLPGYIIEFSGPFLEPVAIDIYPKTLNLKSKGKWITCYIELPEVYNATDIDINTLTIIGVSSIILAEPSPIELNDYNHNGIIDLMVKFDRQSVYDIVSLGLVEITVQGSIINNGLNFYGIDRVLVINKGKAPDK